MVETVAALEMGKRGVDTLDVVETVEGMAEVESAVLTVAAERAWAEEVGETPVVGKAMGTEVE